MEDEPATAVDVVLWSRLEDGRRAVVLIEVKLSEEGFTTCNGRDSRGNRRKHVCKSARLFLSDPNACYLRRPWRKRRDRRYWAIFASAHGSVRSAFPGTDLDGPCPFAGTRSSQCEISPSHGGSSREGTVTEAWFVLCAHDDNPGRSQALEGVDGTPPRSGDGSAPAGVGGRGRGRGGRKPRVGDVDARAVSARHRGASGVSSRSYDRAPSPQLRQLLAPGGYLAPPACGANAGRYRPRSPLRRLDEVHVYCGLTRLVTSGPGTGGKVWVKTHKTYATQSCARLLIRPGRAMKVDGGNYHRDEWAVGEPGFAQAARRVPRRCASR